MKSKIFFLGIALVILICLYLFINEKGRHFYYNKSLGKCVTVWKTIGGKCYVIPGKYKKVLIPTRNFLQIDNTSLISLLWNTTSFVSVVSQPTVYDREANFKLFADTSQINFILDTFDIRLYIEKYEYTMIDISEL